LTQQQTTRVPAGTSGAPTGTRRAFRGDVEGLRAVAVLLVVLYHAHVRAVSGGYIGVDVFFVISGFLITGQLARELEANGRISFLGFYARRARRILPAATLVTITTVVASALLLSPFAARRVYDDAAAAVVFGVNFRFASEGANYFDNDLPPSPLQHFWSLSVEEQFYVVWPVLLVLASLVWYRRRRRERTAVPHQGSASSPGGSHPVPSMPVVVAVLGVIIVVSLAASIHQTPRSPSWAYYSILTRAWELAAGALAALALPRTSRIDRRVGALLSWAGLVCIAIAALAFTDTTPYPGHAALLPVVGAVAVVVGGSAAVRRHDAELLLGTAPFQRIGSWSYSWYLWHWPALILAPALIGHPLTVPEALLVVALALVVAALSFVLVERPIRRMQFVVRRPVVGLGGAGALAVLSFAVIRVAGGLTTVDATGVPTRPALTSSGHLTAAQLSLDIASAVKTTKAPSNLDPPLAKASAATPLIVKNGCHLYHGPTRSKPCIYGDTSSRVSIVLFGDSHAAAWFSALDIIATQHKWRLVILTKAGCPPVEVNVTLALGNQPYPQCTEWRRNAEAQITALHPLLTVAAWARYIEVPEASSIRGVATGYGSTWQDGVAAIFKFLARASQHTVFMSDGPTQNHLAPDCISGHINDVKACVTPLTDAIRDPTQKAEELSLAQRFGIASVDPTSWYCTSTSCPVIVGNIILYRDEAHQTPAWCNFIAPVFAAAIVPVAEGRVSPTARV
jgi:peptidoglycan/LPS O-acetylase OafA/YrhL